MLFGSSLVTEEVAMADRSGPRARPVRDVMSTPVVTAAPSDTLAEAAARMAEHGVGSVVVIESGRVVGILTERDLVRSASQGSDPSRNDVAGWMTESPDTVPPEIAVEEAFASLAEHGYRHIPVVEDDRLAGIVSLRDLMRIARISPVDASSVEVPKGLEGVEVAATEISDVRGKEGFYHYRQYDAIALAENRTLEDVWYLLYEGELPGRAQRRAFLEETRALRGIPDDVNELLPAIARLGQGFEPLEALRAAYSLFAASQDLEPFIDVSREELRSQALRTCAVFPTLVMSLHRLHEDQEPIAPHPRLPWAANYLYMLTGGEPPPEHARALERYLIATIDHGFNASTFSARVVTSTGADLGSAVLGALGALSGPLHGGAPSRALDMIEEIGAPDRTDAWLRAAVESGRRLMGFGHRVYKTDDPRSIMLRRVAESLDGERVELAEHVEKRAVAILEELKPGRALYPNVEFYAGIVLDLIGMPRTLFTPTFASSRVIGWTTHIMEQAADNRLIRPSAHYVGPEPTRAVTSVD
jgi:citrate synthase